MHEVLRIRPVGPVSGEARVSSSKSALARALLCAAGAEQSTELLVADPAADSLVLRDALRTAGVAIEVDSGCWRVAGRKRAAGGGAVSIDLGEAGTVARFLPPFLAAGRGVFRLDGRGRLRERPHLPLAHALTELGARVETERGGALPWTLHAHGLSGAALRVPSAVSSQFLSGLLLVAPLLERGDLELVPVGEARSRPYVEWTRSVMRDFGVAVESDGRAWRVREGARYRSPRLYEVEPDASGAAFFFVAAALTGGEVRVRGLHERSAQGDLASLLLLRELGVETGFDAAGAFARGRAEGALDASFVDAPDLAPAFAVLAAAMPARSRLRGVAALRAKESDRLAALATELRRAGARCEVGADELAIEGPVHRGVLFHTYGDHRLAMAFALLGLVLDEVAIEEPSCVAKSCPRFFEQLARIAPGCVD
ncbi:MAG: 3-phosphoshikimate 1-carboxyvinyltransferase [Planctomycetes bacterium]|nr:3-phosphoshikimate 1-carboxyvinyltransferase [Planctomycetota bacterium]